MPCKVLESCGKHHKRCWKVLENHRRCSVVARCCSISEELDTNAGWQSEGRRLVPPVHRHVSHATHKSLSHSQLRSERPTNLRSAAAVAAAAPSTTKLGAQSSLDCRQLPLYCFDILDWVTGRASGLELCFNRADAC